MKVLSLMRWVWIPVRSQTQLSEKKMRLDVKVLELEMSQVANEVGRVDGWTMCEMARSGPFGGESRWLSITKYISLPAST